MTKKPPRGHPRPQSKRGRRHQRPRINRKRRVLDRLSDLSRRRN